jgi:hypothetical protein
VTTVTLAHDLPKGAHNLQAWFDLRDETDTYGPKDAQTIKSIFLDAGSTLESPAGAVAALPDTMMIMGDSLTKGYQSTDPTRASDSSNYPLTTFAATLGRALNCEYGIVGQSGQGWANNANSWNEVFPIAFRNYFRGHPRVWPTGLKYLVVAEGTNDGGDITSTVQGWLPQARRAVGGGTWIILVAPFNGGHISQLEAAAAAYKTSSRDAKVVVVTPSAVLSTSNNGAFYTVDGTHPAPLLHPLYGAILAGEILESTAR